MVKQARKVGVGGHVEGMVGAMVDNSYEGPVKLSGTVVYVSPKKTRTRNHGDGKEISLS